MEYPRELAVKILTRVLSDNQPLDEAFAELGEELSPSARAWLQEVCSGTLRWKSRLEMAIDAGALKKKPSGWLRKVLLVAAYQLIVQERTSPGAVVSETVNLVKKRDGEAPAKFANALLRKIADHGGEWKTLPHGDSEWACLPDWIWQRLIRQRGVKWARAYATASLERPVTWARARSADWKPEWAEAGPIPLSWKVTEAGAIPDKKGFTEGEFIIQDISSQTLVAEITRHVKRSSAALDLCAAPGGKSVGMAWNGLQVSASDRDEARLSLLRQTLERSRAEVKIVDRDKVSELPEQDLVWVDSPCTGTGIIRRHPDVRWLRQERELTRLLELQQTLIAEGWAKVKSGGYFAYSVCSVLEEEGSGAIAKASLPGAELVREWFLTPQEVPHGDGFWAVLIKKL